MKKIKASVCAVTHAGRIRKENEDNYSLNGRLTSTGDLKKGSAFVQTMKEPFHLAVCDGMGGESYGDIASGFATETIASHAANVYESGEDFSFAISNSLVEANSRICEEIQARGKRMGTTLAAVYAVKGKLYCVNIGDTRIYHYSKGILEQISFDHTHAQTIIDAGAAMMDEIGRIPDAKKLTRHLGVFPNEASLSPNISVIDDVDDGDVLLLCSDGLTDMLTDDEITAVLSTAENSQSCASKLVRLALEKGGKDNITAIAAFINVEETAIFAPIAAAMVGGADTSYEEEYRHSYGGNQFVDEENAPSPYANADARAHIKPVDKMKIAKIVGIILLVALVIVAAALIIKAVIDSNDSDDDKDRRKNKTTTSEGSTYDLGGNVTDYITEPWATLPTETESSTDEESTTDEPSTTPSTRKPAPTRPKTTKPKTTKPKTTKPATTKPQTTTEPATEVTTVPSTEESTTAPVTDPVTQPTEPATEPEATQPTTPATEPATQQGEQNNQENQGGQENQGDQGEQNNQEN